MSEPTINRLQASAKGVGENVTEAFQNVGQNLSETVQNMQKSMDGFTQQGVTEAGTDFLNTNGLLAKFVFIIFILFAFMFLLNLGMHVIGFLSKPSENPILVKGKLNGDEGITITQDPSNLDSKTVFRSNNQMGGAEFTWSSWLYLNKSVSDDRDGSKLKHIFSKGEGSQGSDDLRVSNGPGVYMKTSADGITSLEVRMDTVGNAANPINTSEKIVIEDIPMKKWFHIAIRLQNKVLDVYVNGVVKSRKNFTNLPKQNYHNVTVGKGNGFNGSISNLQYFNYALNVFEINNIVTKGPNTASSDLSADAAGKGGNYSYLSNIWYRS
jgi:hypothetical protein